MAGPTPRVVELAQRFRAALLARERRTASAMVRYYGRIWQDLQAPIGELRAEIEAMREAGEEVSRGMVERLDRMRDVQAQAADEAARFAQFADQAITAAQREAIAAGERDGHDLLLGSFPTDADIQISFRRMPREAVEALAGVLQDGSPLMDLLTEAVGGASREFGEQMVMGLAEGWGPRRLARELRAQFGMGLTRTLRIARTEQLRAYRTATLSSYQESGVLQGWERMATQDTRTCMACVMLDGRRYGLDEPMDDHPQGRCAMLPITLPYSELGGAAPEPDFQRELASDWFRRQDEATQRQMLTDSIASDAYDAWQDGLFRLADIPKVRRSDVWGDSWTPKSLADLVGE